MIGYLHSGDDFSTCMIAPASAQPLVDFYENIVNLYISDFTIHEGSLIGGDSDHTSFNNNGYMGIFPFEDCSNYSPYIHTENDIIGPSVNSPEKCRKFTQSGVAFIAEGAIPFSGLYPPMNLSMLQHEDVLQLNWELPLSESEDLSEYNIYRNSELYETITDINQLTFTDNSVTDGIEYEYYLTAVYDGVLSGESSPSNKVSVIMGLNEIYFWDFEDGIQNWTIENSSSGWQYGIDVNIPGNSSEYLSIDSDGAGSGNHVYDYAISPELNLESYNLAFLEFDYGYKDYFNDFLKVLYRTSSGAWNEIESLVESESFSTRSIELPENALRNNLQISFYYDDNNDWAWHAAIDNIKIAAASQYSDITMINNEKIQFSIYPNPANSLVTLDYTILTESDVEISLIDYSGNLLNFISFKNQEKGNYKKEINTEQLKSGIYFYQIKTKNRVSTHKMIILK